MRGTLLVGILLAGILLAGEAAAQQQAGPKALTEVEALKGENLTLKFDSLDKQMRLIEAQYRELDRAKQDLMRQFGELELAIISSHALAGEHRVNWQSKMIEAVPKKGEDAK